MRHHAETQHVQHQSTREKRALVFKWNFCNVNTQVQSPRTQYLEFCLIVERALDNHFAVGSRYALLKYPDRFWLHGIACSGHGLQRNAY